MTADLDERTYDLLRLIRVHEPIGSIRLVELMHRHGYSIQDRTIRLTLAELDDQGLTTKVPGKGRRLTQGGHDALETGNVDARLEQIRARIATLTSKATYDPLEDAGELVAAVAYLDAADVGQALERLTTLTEHPLAPCPVAVTESGATEPRDVRVALPSSLTLDGVLLSGGISTNLVTGAIAEYEPTPDPDDLFIEDPMAVGGGLVQYIDAINGEGSSIDIVRLLIEAGRTDVSEALDADRTAAIVVDNREFPLARYEEGRDLAVATRNSLGGVIDLRRPREDGPFPRGDPGWDFCSLTYGAIGELGLAALAEQDLTTDWVTLYSTLPRNTFEPVSVAATEWDAETE